MSTPGAEAWHHRACAVPAQMGCRPLATQSLDSAIKHPQKRNIAVERLDDLEAFLAIIEKGSQAAAARHLRRPLQSLNRSLIALERAVGVELVKRTTRRSEPTEAGRIFYDRIRPAVAAIMEARNEAANVRGEVSGSLKVGAPVLFASSHVAAIVGQFLKLYPNVEVELRASDDQVDLLAEGLDVAVRIGDSIDGSLVARRLHALRVVTFGAPSYFAEHGRPTHPKDLEHHRCILRAAAEVVDRWPFRIGGKLEPIAVHGRFRSNSAAAIGAAALAWLACRYGRSGTWSIRARSQSCCRSLKRRECRSSWSGLRRGRRWSACGDSWTFWPMA